jgi:hypothetical protein
MESVMSLFTASHTIASLGGSELCSVYQKPHHDWFFHISLCLVSLASPPVLVRVLPCESAVCGCWKSSDNIENNKSCEVSALMCAGSHLDSRQHAFKSLGIP